MHMHAPHTPHMHALKLILCYIRGILSYGLTIQKLGICSLLSYTDADWAGCPDTCHSTTG